MRRSFILNSEKEGVSVTKKTHTLRFEGGTLMTAEDGKM